MMPHNKAALDFLKRLEENPDTHKLASEFISKPIDCKFNKNSNGNYLLAFELNDDLFVDGASSDTFFEKPLLLNAYSHLIVIYNFNVECIKKYFAAEPNRYEIEIKEFRAYVNGVQDDWKNGKHTAFVKYHKDQFDAWRLGVIFDVEEPTGVLPNKALSVQVGGVDIVFSYERIDDEYYGLFFLSQNIDFELFQKATDVILVTCGLMSGCYHKDNVFFVSATNGKNKQISFCYRNIRQGIYHKYPLITSGPYGDLDKEEYNLSSSHFNKLVNLLYNNEKYLRSAMLLISAGSLTGCAKSSSGAVALETVSGVIAGKGKSKSIIEDKACSRKVIYELRKSLKKFKDNIGKDKFEIIDNKLCQINSTPNITKLEDAFIDNDITLSNDELFALRCRNFILHGSVPKNEEYNAISEGELLELVAHRLVMLAGMLLFKQAGYNKRIIDWGMTELIKKRHIMSGKKVPKGQCLRDISQTTFDIDE